MTRPSAEQVNVALHSYAAASGRLLVDYPAMEAALTAALSLPPSPTAISAAKAEACRKAALLLVKQAQKLGELAGEYGDKGSYGAAATYQARADNFTTAASMVEDSAVERASATASQEGEGEGERE